MSLAYPRSRAGIPSRTRRRIRRLTAALLAGGLCAAPATPAAHAEATPQQELPPATGPAVGDPAETGSAAAAARANANSGTRVADVTPPRLLNRDEIARLLADHSAGLLVRDGIEPVVVILVVVDTGGRPTRIEVVRGGSADRPHDLERIAERVAAAFRFEPAKRGGMAVPMAVEVPLRFQPRPPRMPAEINGREVAEARGRLYRHGLRSAGRSGAVTLALSVDGAGAVRGIRFLAGSGDPELDRIAVELAGMKEFEPLRPAGARRPVWMLDRITFGDVPREHPRIVNAVEVTRRLRELYPAELRVAGIGGTTVLWVNVGERGRPIATRIGSSSGHPELDLAARMVARAMIFEPGTVGAGPVPMWVRQPVVFRAD